MTDETTPFAIENAAGSGDLLVVCDHASNRFPAPWGDLGLAAEDREAHIAWDPGALAVCRHLARLADAPLFHGTVSRLIVDVNRPEDSPTLAPDVSEATPVPGNAGLSDEARRARIAAIHAPYHAGLDRFVGEQVERRRRAGAPAPTVVGVHTFTPVFLGVTRPLHVGVLYGEGNPLGPELLAALAAEEGVVAEANEPYSGSGEVYYTMARHAVARGLANVMIEIRNDLLATDAEARLWAERLWRPFARRRDAAGRRAGAGGR